MRQISYKNEMIDLSCAADLSTNWDKKYPQDDVEYLIVNASVLGNALGRTAIDADDTSSAWKAVHGRKYNNARISIPFTRGFVSAHMEEIENVTSIIARKCTGACAVVQRMMSDEQKSQGRETAMRTQAIREAKDILIAAGKVIDGDLFNEANASVRAQVAAKVNFEFGVSVSARRISDTDGLNDKKQFKRKNVVIGTAPTVGYVVTMDEKGLKKVPLVTKEMRDKAETTVLEFAKVVHEEINKIAADPTDEKCLAAAKAISEKMPGDAKISVEIPEYNEDELSKIREWRDEVVGNYNVLKPKNN